MKKSSIHHWNLLKGQIAWRCLGSCTIHLYIYDASKHNWLMRKFFCKWWRSWLPFGDMKVTNIWKIIFRFRTFQQWNFRGQQVLTNCWPVQWRPNVKIHFLTIFRKISGYWRGSPSNVAEKFWEEIWSFSTCRNNIIIIIFNKHFSR